MGSIVHVLICQERKKAKEHSEECTGCKELLTNFLHTLREDKVTGKMSLMSLGKPSASPRCVCHSHRSRLITASLNLLPYHLKSVYVKHL